MKKLLIVKLLLLSSIVNAGSISLDIGQTQAVFNRFAIPNTSESRVSLPVEDTLTSYRLTGYHELEGGNELYYLIAPLSTTYKFDSAKNFEFDGTDFTSGEATSVDYQFSSYRLGYLWTWRFSSIKLWAGVVGKIRDAEIKVKQGGSSSSYSNIGFVPLGAFGVDWRLTRTFSIFSHTDAMTASQGSAYDSQVELRANLDGYALSFGKRVLGGGADNDKVYNFAQFDTHYARYTYHY